MSFNIYNLGLFETLAEKNQKCLDEAGLMPPYPRLRLASKRDRLGHYYNIFAYNQFFLSLDEGIKAMEEVKNQPEWVQMFISYTLADVGTRLPNYFWEFCDKLINIIDDYVKNNNHNERVNDQPQHIIKIIFASSFFAAFEFTDFLLGITDQEDDTGNFNGLFDRLNKLIVPVGHWNKVKCFFIDNNLDSQVNEVIRNLQNKILSFKGESLVDKMIVLSIVEKYQVLFFQQSLFYQLRDILTYSDRTARALLTDGLVFKELETDNQPIKQGSDTINGRITIDSHTYITYTMEELQKEKNSLTYANVCFPIMLTTLIGLGNQPGQSLDCNKHSHHSTSSTEGASVPSVDQSNTNGGKGLLSGVDDILIYYAQELANELLLLPTLHNHEFLRNPLLEIIKLKKWQEIKCEIGQISNDVKDKNIDIEPWCFWPGVGMKIPQRSKIIFSADVLYPEWIVTNSPHNKTNEERTLIKEEAFRLMFSVPNNHGVYPQGKGKTQENIDRMIREHRYFEAAERIKQVEEKRKGFFTINSSRPADLPSEDVWMDKIEVSLLDNGVSEDGRMLHVILPYLAPRFDLLTKAYFFTNKNEDMEELLMTTST